MAVTVTWDMLRDLATVRAESGCAIRLYLDLDPSASPTPAAVDSRINAHLDAIEKSAGGGDMKLAAGRFISCCSSPSPPT